MTREQAWEAVHNPNGPPKDPAERRAFEKWLDRDPELRELMEQQSALFEALDEWCAPEPSAEFDRVLAERVEAERARRGWLDSVRDAVGKLSAPRWAALGTCAAALAAALWLGPAPGSDVDQAPKTAAALPPSPAADAYFDELDQALDDLEMLVDFDVAVPASTAAEGRS